MKEFLTIRLRMPDAAGTTLVLSATYYGNLVIYDAARGMSSFVTLLEGRDMEEAVDAQSAVLVALKALGARTLDDTFSTNNEMGEQS